MDGTQHAVVGSCKDEGTRVHGSCAQCTRHGDGCWSGRRPVECVEALALGMMQDHDSDLAGEPIDVPIAHNASLLCCVSVSGVHFTQVLSKFLLGKVSFFGRSWKRSGAERKPKLFAPCQTSLRCDSAGLKRAEF